MSISWKRTIGYGAVFVIALRTSYSFKNISSGYDDVVPLFELSNNAPVLRLVFIGSSACPISNNDETHRLVIRLRNKMRDLAQRHGYAFVSTGVSVDQSAKRGVEYLNRSGPYNEIISGLGHLNLGIDRHVWDRFAGDGSLPQVLVTPALVRRNNRWMACNV